METAKAGLEVNRKRNHGLDLLRILSICGVVAIHVFGVRVGAAPKNGPSWWTATAIDIGFIWVVPVFIMISGALLLGSQRMLESPGKFYRKRAARILPALIAWNLIYLVGVRIWLRHEELTGARILQLLYDGSVFTQLYFLWIVVGLYAVAPVIGLFLSMGKPSWSLWTAGILLVTSILAYLLPTVLSHYGIMRPINLNFLTLWIPYTGYFVAGYALRNVRLKGLHLFWLVPAVAAMASFTIWHYGNRGVLPKVDVLINESYFGLFVAAVSLGVFVLALSITDGMEIPQRCASAVRAMSEASFGVFLVHYVIFEVIRLNFTGVSTQHSLRALAVAYVVTLAGSFAVSVIALRIPGIKRIF